ncbi:hypothetical protein HX109_00245 [Galbibacter sp. BG1]|uniref:DUF5996 family protein n=1 Tax=Galbibacter sp. BG1 TaxID=1170699 RepID=UPI0015BCC25F|nr:DUF5996 family protein [Galbibacter sp. BG1]QLE00060.1 hypothetical protein HX109_00245 [Galbibacter sp. BG1]
MENKKHWPVLNFNEMKETIATLHQWIQIVGKIRLREMPWQNQSWHVTLYISTCGFTTQAIPYDNKTFELEFDFKKHQLIIKTSEDETADVDLYSRTVADFYNVLFEKLSSLGIDVDIHGSPNEMEPAIPFVENTVNKTYNPSHAFNIWKAMLKTNAVFTKFRGEFTGKCSPVHLFWGAFDLAVTRFSGRPAPKHPGGVPNMPLEVMQEAYSEEVSSAGFWLGSDDFPEPAFYSYIYPTNDNFSKQKIEPREAFYSEDLGEFLLKYETVQKAENPEDKLYTFLKSTYVAGANTANWDRKKLEK